MELALHHTQCKQHWGCPFYSYISFLFLSYILRSTEWAQWEMHLGQTESSHPLYSFLCRARKNTGVLSLCCMIKNNFRRCGDLIGGLAPPSGSRRQRDNTGLSFRHTYFLQKLKPTTSSYWHLLLPNVSLLPTHKRVPDLTPWHFYILDSALQSPTPPRRTWELVAGCPKVADTWTGRADIWTKVNKK